MIKRLLFAFLLITLCSHQAWATMPPVGSGTVNGVTYNTVETGSVYGRRYDRFDLYNTGTSNAYVYNSSGGTLTANGSVPVHEFQYKTIIVDITGITTDAGTTTIGIFYAIGSTTPWVVGTESVISGTSSFKYAIPLDDRPEFIRIGAKRSGTSTASLTVKELYLRESGGR
mgnify:FL=1